MFVANWTVGYVPHSEGFETERAAEVFLEAELRRTGSRYGVVFEIDGEMP